jgi:hypothetical protein
VLVASLPPVGVGRCPSCGERGTLDPPPRLLRLCLRCCHPFLAEARSVEVELCGECTPAQGPLPPPEAAVVKAAEAELLAALAARWRFVGTESLCAYLDRVAREVGRKLGAEPRVVPFEGRAVRTLALPSGVVLVSVGTIARIADEAELAFVLAHEIAHAVTADAPAILVASCLGAVSRDGAGEEVWAAAAGDLARLGYGDGRECDADERALDAVVAAGYDARSAFAWLGRLDDGALAGEADLAETCLAHPPAAERRRRLEERHARRTEDAPVPARRVERAVFRRAAGHSVLSAGLPSFDPLGDVPAPHAARAVRRAAWWTAAAILLLAIALLVVAGLLAD